LTVDATKGDKAVTRGVNDILADIGVRATGG
jgi:hypothetical protein